MRHYRSYRSYRSYRRATAKAVAVAPLPHYRRATANQAAVASNLLILNEFLFFWGDYRSYRKRNACGSKSGPEKTLINQPLSELPHYRSYRTPKGVASTCGSSPRGVLPPQPGMGRSAPPTPVMKAKARNSNPRC